MSRRKRDWRKFYAAKMLTTADHVFYWWELLKKMQAIATDAFSGDAMDSYVYGLSEGVYKSQIGQQILSRHPLDSQDDTEEIPF